MTSRAFATVSVALLTTITLSLPTQANTYEKLAKASAAACENFKACALQEIEGDASITPEMRQMVEGMVSGVCENMIGFTQADQHESLHEPAIACLNSMANLSCSELQDGGETAACQELNQLLENYEY
ncbi:hypothetical protein QTP81_07705 [Alteromonas sp. ASW11-36]|uniref:Uncharacterized protein n=1 Tax=Alteromonas arenosi TaxID=3055817 RepID=A0ABT7SWD3_9ALTE|nr:hypothetical protein [Alteromonas sp. ASW11-36]MDM7860478.1 hypothetical protein [Alteromonas sp. ASW11-36]